MGDKDNLPYEDHCENTSLLGKYKNLNTQSLHPEEWLTLIQRKMARMEFLYIRFIRKKKSKNFFFLVKQGVDFHPYPLISQESKMKFDRKSAHFGAFSALLEQNLEKVKSGAKRKTTP